VDRQLPGVSHHHQRVAPRPATVTAPRSARRTIVPAIGAADADADGFTNQDEITSFSSPGTRRITGGGGAADDDRGDGRDRGRADDGQYTQTKPAPRPR
jgi:hypothetical protein